MVKMTEIQKVAKWADTCRQTGGSFEVHHRKGSSQRVMTNIQWGRNSETGRRTKFVVECLDGGEQRCYDKHYDLEVTEESVPPVVESQRQW